MLSSMKEEHLERTGMGIATEQLREYHEDRAARIADGERRTIRPGPEETRLMNLRTTDDRVQDYMECQWQQGTEKWKKIKDNTS